MKRFLLLFALSLVLLLCACGQKGNATAATSSHMSLQSSPAAEEDNRQPPEPATGLEKPQPEAAEDPSLAVLRQDMGDNFCGIALLGRLPEGTSLEDFLQDSGALEAQPFLSDVGGEEILRAPGTELYCLVPKAPGDKLEVYEWICNEENHFQGEAGDLLYQSESGAPVILMGNENDVMPNLLVVLTDATGTTLRYNPSLSLCDGSVDLPVEPSLYDFSRYDAIGVAQW